MTTRPALLIDVDGPLNPYAQSNRQLRKNKEYTSYKLNGFWVWLNRWHGQELLKLADLYELIWCTTWEHDANMLIGPKIGLPKLPVITFDNMTTTPDWPQLYWKTNRVVEHCKGRPFAWVDDEITTTDYDYTAEHHDAPALLRWIDPTTGLTEPDFQALADWPQTLTTGDAA